MSLPRTAQPVVTPPPVSGMDQLSPLAAMDPTSATWLLNVDCENQYVKSRPGTSKHSRVTAVVILGMGVYGFGSTQKLFAYVADGTATNKVYDVSTSTPSLVFTCADANADEAVWVPYNSRGTFVVESLATSSFATYDGSTWANAWVERSAGNKITLSPSAWYKSRVYAVYDNLVYYDTALNKVTGVLNTTTPTQDVFTFSKSMSFICTFSQSDGVINQEYIAFGNVAGEILVYTGDNPGAANWAIAAKFKTPRPLGYRRGVVIQYQNDALLVTRSGLISMREMFVNGNDAAVQFSLSSKIDEYWATLFANVSEGGGSTYSNVCGVWAEKKQKLYIMVQGHISESGTYTTEDHTLLVMNTNTKAWSIYKIPQIYTGSLQNPGNMVVFNDEVYWASGPAIIKLDETVFTDYIEDPFATASQQNFDIEISGPYQSYGGQNAITKVAGYQPIVDQGLRSLTVKARSDFGLKETLATTPAIQVGFSKPFCSVGVEGTFFQYVITGKTRVSSTNATKALSFYSMNVLFEKGGVL